MDISIVSLSIQCHNGMNKCFHMGKNSSVFFFVYLQLKLSDCDSNGINHSNDNLISSNDMLATKCHDTIGNNINHSGTANGSLITMTMKNNHLIVETEERSVSKHSSNMNFTIRK